MTGQSLIDFKNRHAGETVIVCGCGSSLSSMPRDYGGVTIGVNDVGRLFDPTYLVVLNPRHQFRDDRFRYVISSRAQAIFTQLDLGVRHPGVVRFRLGQRGGTQVHDPARLPYTRNSPYVALCLALYMGARRIGLIGVDFTPNHFFAATGIHPLERELTTIDEEYRRLAAAHPQVEIVNLSADSRLTALEKRDCAQFLSGRSGVVRRVATPGGARPEGSPASGLARRGIAVERHKPGIVGDFMDALAGSAAQLGCRVTRDVTAVARRPEVVKVVWNGRHLNGAGPVIYCEHGWLPRWSYQVSPAGINASSHLAPFSWDGIPLEPARRNAVAAHLQTLRQSAPPNYAYMQTDVAAVTEVPDAFLLVPLQMEWDTNIVRHVPKRLRRMQALMDEIARSNPPLPVVYKQHPADVRRGNQQLRLRTRRPQDSIWAHNRGNVHALLKSGRCRGVVSLNSNVVHDAMVWHVPAVVLGANIWPRSGQVTPFPTHLPEDWDLLFDWYRDPVRNQCIEAYADYLMRSQWTLERAGDPEQVAELLRAAAPVNPVARPRPPLAVRRTRNELINVVARNRGWLFEDLKRHFVEASGSGATVVASEQPRRDADGWIFIRTHEAGSSPDPSRTLVQVHDLFGSDHYRPGGDRHALTHCAAVTLAHPAQRELIAGGGIDLSGKQLLIRPLGALRAFRLRQRRAPEFTVGWVGRPAVHGGVEMKRVDWFVQAVSALSPPPQVVLLGERLDTAARQLAGASIPCRYLEKRRHGLQRYPQIYQQFDCLVISSVSEAGPICLFEALASGVPVVSTAAGWATQMIRDGDNGYLVSTVDQMAAAVESIRENADAWFARRAVIRDSLGGHTLEGWVEENLQMVRSLLGAEEAPAPLLPAAAIGR